MVITIGKNDVRILAPHFQMQLFEQGRSFLRNIRAGFGATGKRNNRNLRMLRNRCSHFVLYEMAQAGIDLSKVEWQSH